MDGIIEFQTKPIKPLITLIFNWLGPYLLLLFYIILLLFSDEDMSIIIIDNFDWW